MKVSEITYRRKDVSKPRDYRKSEGSTVQSCQQDPTMETTCTPTAITQEKFTIVSGKTLDTSARSTSEEIGTSMRKDATGATSTRRTCGKLRKDVTRTMGTTITSTMVLVRNRRIRTASTANGKNRTHLRRVCT